MKCLCEPKPKIWESHSLRCTYVNNALRVANKLHQQECGCAREIDTDSMWYEIGLLELEIGNYDI